MSDHSSQMSKSPTSSRSQSEEKCELPCEGDLSVIRRMLGQIQKPFDESQRENIFHTRCLINNKLCSLIADGGSCTNVASKRVVEKLGLSIISHAKPYKLQWLSKESESMVNKQLLKTFPIGKYKDEVLCDVVLMEIIHILLGRSWQYDIQVLHDGLTNHIYFNFQGHKVILKPFSPKEVHEDQIKMKNKRENEKEKESKVKLSHKISSYTTKSIFLTRDMLQTAPSRFPSSLSFSLPNKSNYLTSWTKKIWDEHQTPPKDSHLLRGFFFSKPFHPQIFFPNMACKKSLPF